MKKNKIDVIMGFVAKLIAANKLEVTAADGSKPVLETKTSSSPPVAGAVAQHAHRRQEDHRLHRKPPVLPQQPKEHDHLRKRRHRFPSSRISTTASAPKLPLWSSCPRSFRWKTMRSTRNWKSNSKSRALSIATSNEVTSVDTSGTGVKAKVKTQSGEVVLETTIFY